MKHVWKVDVWVFRELERVRLFATEEVAVAWAANADQLYDEPTQRVKLSTEAARANGDAHAWKSVDGGDVYVGVCRMEVVE